MATAAAAATSTAADASRNLDRQLFAAISYKQKMHLVSLALALSPPSRTGAPTTRPALTLTPKTAAFLGPLTALPGVALADVVDNPYNRGFVEPTAAGDGGFLADAGESIVNLVLLAAVGGLGLFILSFFGEAAVTAADASKELATKLDAQDKAAGRPRAAKPSGPVFDDSANPNDAARMATLTKGTRTTSSIKDKNQKIDFTKSENGFDFAPWMQIDQRAVAKAEAQRRAKKAQLKRK